MSIIDINSLKCDGCPAKYLLDEKRIKQVESKRFEALKKIKSGPKFILLGESAPKERFIYDRKSQYKTGLRNYLRKELVQDKSEDELFEFMTKKGIWIVDCAFCPIHLFRNEKSKRRLAATICLERHTFKYLDLFPEAPLISIFPSKCGFLKRKLPHINTRIMKKLKFSEVKGLRNLINGEV